MLFRSKTQKYIDFWKQYPYGKTGVYQLSLNKPKELVDKDIVYIGVSGTIHNRISNIRTCGGRGSSKSTHHNAGVYMRYNNITPDDVFVRILFVKKLKDAKSLEKELQQAHRTKFNYPLGFKWTEASGGKKSCKFTAMASIDRCDLVQCRELLDYLQLRIYGIEQASLMRFFE